jgi:hypothetical protein
MKFAIVFLALVALASATTLSGDNYDSETAGKTVRRSLA